MQAIFVVPLDEMGKLLSAIIEGLVVRQMTSSYFRLHVRVVVRMTASRHADLHRRCFGHGHILAKGLRAALDTQKI